MCDVLRSALTLDPLVFAVTETIMLLVPPDMRLQGLALAMAISGWYLNIHREPKP